MVYVKPNDINQVCYYDYCNIMSLYKKNYTLYSLHTAPIPYMKILFQIYLNTPPVFLKGGKKRTASLQSTHCITTWPVYLLFVNGEAHIREGHKHNLLAF